MLSQSANCHVHPQRLGIGICVKCRQVICAECSTPMDGINLCARCVAALAPRPAEDDEELPREWTVGSVLFAAVAFAALGWGASALADWLAP